MRIVIALLLLALPVQAEDCFSGLPKRVSFDNGKTITIIQRRPHRGACNASTESE